MRKMDIEEVVTTKRRERLETLVLDETMETLQKTHIECPDCGNKEKSWRMRQTRASDETETRICRCTKCGYTWEEILDSSHSVVECVCNVLCSFDLGLFAAV
ncbi:MAG: RPA12/RPB9/RPC11 RNA polymerase family protein [Candidatus Bathyarchaeia archaeon]